MQKGLLPVVQDALESYGVEHKVFECDPQLADTASFCEAYGYLPEQSANTIIVASRIEPVSYACCVVLATTKLDVNKTVSKLMGIKKVSFAPMDKALELSGMEYGGVTAFGLPNDVPVYVDSRVLKCPEIVMGGGNRSSKIILNPNELVKIPHALVIDGLAKS
jgi:prolyl-tRNA editing enzyme YbaK/EbsC (Cys-tRNA(Pro) deacylase)